MSPISQSLTPSPEPNTQPQSAAHTRKAAKPRHRHGYVARLPKASRDTICQMLNDGAPYKDILQKLGPEAKGLSKHHISEWKQGGFTDWQRENQWLEELRAQQQFALDMLLSGGQTKLPHVILQIAATQIFQALRKVAPDNLNGKFDSDPANYTRLLNSLSRLSRSSLHFTKYEDLRADLKAKEFKPLDPNRKLSEHQSKALMKIWEDFFLGPDYWENLKNEPFPPVHGPYHPPEQSNSAAEPQPPTIPSQPPTQ